MKMNKKFIAGAAAALVGSLVLGSVALAQGAPAKTIDELIARVGKDSRDARAQANARVSEFQKQVGQQKALLRSAKAKLAKLRAQEKANSAKFDANEKKIDTLDDQLRQAQGSFGELFGAARQSAGELKATLDQSYVSGEFPGRGEALEKVSESNTLPEVSELENIYQTMLQEMAEQAKVVTFKAQIGDKELPVTRAGTFLGWTANNYEFLKVSDGELSLLDRQPSGRIRHLAKNVSTASPDSFVPGPIDPGRGALLSMVVKTPSLLERYNAGGWIGYAVTAMAALGLIIGLWRLLALSTTGMAVRAQKRSQTPGNNPLGRVMSAYEKVKDRDLETVEMKIDDAILRESGKLDYGISLIKVMAAVSPLMGLLGTVIGMIQTFQAITLFGAGDPRLMADGISFALVTTVLGLLSAIPLLLVHSFCSSAARSVQQVLEEQAAGMIATNAEARGK